MKIAQIMHRNVIYATKDDTVETAAKLLQKGNVGSIPVVDDRGMIKGIVTDRDIVTRCVANEEDPRTTKVGDIMTRGVFTVTDDTDAETASRIMAAQQIRRLPVVRERRVVGMVSLGDLAKTPSYYMEAGEALTEISADRKTVL